MNSLKKLNYIDLATEIIYLYTGDFLSKKELNEIVKKSYSNFREKNVVKIVELNQLKILELFHGPTLAFKDIAMQLIGNMYEHLLKSNNETINLKDGVKNTLVTRLGLQVKMVDAGTGLYMTGSGLGKAVTTRELTLLNDENLDDVKFNQSSIGTSTKKALETATAKVVKRMIRKGIFDH